MMIEDILSRVEICDKCHKTFTFEQRLFPLLLKRCHICKRLLCPNCWGHKHLLAWKYCAHCQPAANNEQGKELK